MKPKVAIIILTYNSLENTTKPCVESVLRVSNELVFHLVLVDNGSIDATPDYLRSIAQSRSSVSVVLNNRNLGFAAGNNVGIREVEADYYVLLNSDTLVTDHWLDKLIGFLQAHPEVGLAGPVSNSVGNEQMIHVESADETHIIREGLSWVDGCRGDFFFTSMLGFFCVVIRRTVIQKIGLLDESFGIGMFEDDDFCRRVIQAGHRLACVEDVFVYHRGSFSFRQIPRLYELHCRNRRRYEEKHGLIWSNRMSVAILLDQIETYLSMHRGEPTKLHCKIANKVKILKRLKCESSEVELESVRSHVAAIHSSTSWRIGSAITHTLAKLPGAQQAWNAISKRRTIGKR